MTSSFDPGASAVPYRFRVDGFDDDHFRVHAFTGKEALSEPYAFDLVLTAETEADEDVERLALGRRAVLTWTIGTAPRAFYGIVAAVRLDEVHDTHRSVQYHVRFVPRLWLLKRRRQSRIFQNLRVPDMVDAVLKEAGIPTRWQLRREYPVREYVTQYEETDLRFVRRLLAEAGIYFLFPEGPEVDAAATAEALIPGDTVVFGDDAAWYPPIGGDDPASLASASADPQVPGAATDAPPLFFLAMQNTTTGHSDKITRFAARTTVRPTRASFREYDPDRPQARPGSSATSNAPFPDADPNASGGTPAAGSAADLEVYDHHGAFLFPKWASTGDEAALMLRQKRRRALTAAGESGCPDLAPGHRFALQDHPATHLDRAWVVISVDHRGQAHPQKGAEWKVYDSSFECAPAEVTYLMPRPRRRSVQVALTATVVGPAGEEIHVDASGQIKVQFHWDRQGGGNERSSCWIRTMQAWGGAGWGTQFIPRVGMEVVVVFEGGDTDKPMVLGSLYNGTHPPPFALPQNKTRSGWRTQSTPGGSGFNEISFEDASSKEQIYLHAQRNLDEVIEKNHTLLVKDSEFVRILGSRMDTVEKNLQEHIKGSHVRHVDGDRIDVVSGNSDDHIRGMLVTRVEGRERHNVQGATDIEYFGDATTRARGCLTTIVGKSDKPRSWVTHAEGTVKLSSSNSSELSSTGEIVLCVGKSSIRITSDKIELISAAVTATGAGSGFSASEDGLALSSTTDAQIVAKKKLVLKTTGASIALEKQVRVDGSEILLNSPAQAKDPPPKAPEPPTVVQLTGDDGEPLPQQRFLVKLDDDTEVGGLTGKDGSAQLTLKTGGKILFPDLTMATAGGGNGEMRPHVILQGEFLFKLAAADGFDPDSVWKHPKNDDIRALRKDHNILAAGDVVFLPQALKENSPLIKGGTNKYVAKVPKLPVRLSFRDASGRLANAAFIVEGLPKPVRGTSKGDGGVEISVPYYVTEVRVHFPDLDKTFTVFVGHMDPVGEPSGVKARLAHLGYLHPRAHEHFDFDVPSEPRSEDDDDARTAAAVRCFQQDHQINPTGVIDDSTRAALVAAHGS